MRLMLDVEPASFSGRVLAQANLSNPGVELDLSVGGVLETSLTTIWILFSAYLVFFMQCGFALLEAGTVRMKNVRNILLKNAIDAAVSVIMWWAVGSAFFGIDKCGGNGFIGSSSFFSSGSAPSHPTYYARWLFGWAFSATSATIVSGAMAERARFRSYVCYTLLISGLVYPVVAHWVWSLNGWLSPSKRDCATGQLDVTLSGTVGLIDFSGSGVVHVTGGAAALMGAWILGPRLGRFSKDGHVIEMAASSPAQQALGTFILWFGWYGFNPGSTLCVYGCMELASKIAVNTTLGAGAAALTVLSLMTMLGHPGDIGPMLNGVLAGLVSITGPCAVIQSYAAVVVGIVGGCVYVFSAKLLRRLHIDDPLEASCVHLFCGAWGLIAAGFFATEAGVQMAYKNTADYGVFYGGSGRQLGVQLLGLLCIFTWSATLIGALFLFLRKIGWLRATPEAEAQGLDHTQGIGSGAGLFCRCFCRCFS